MATEYEYHQKPIEPLDDVNTVSLPDDAVGVTIDHGGIIPNVSYLVPVDKTDE